MNLHCEEVELYQTPTWVTWLCYYSNYDKKIPSTWQDIREKYILWFLNRYSPMSSDDRETNKEHVNTLRSKKHLTFGII